MLALNVPLLATVPDICKIALETVKEAPPGIVRFLIAMVPELITGKADALS